jgi:carbonic anhydrase
VLSEQGVPDRNLDPQICSPLPQLGLDLGDCHVIRNAGGSAFVDVLISCILPCLFTFSRHESIRSIVISQRLLGTREIAVFHHVGCGMLTFTSEQLRTTIKDAQPQNTEVADAVGKMDFLEFSKLEESVKADIRFLKESPLVLTETTITGWIYDVETGEVRGISQTYNLLLSAAPR